MKHKFLALAIIVLACTVGGGTLASTASADGPNCTNLSAHDYYHNGPYNWYYGTVSGCNAYVNAVQIENGGGYATQIYDGSWNQNHPANWGSSPTWAYKTTGGTSWSFTRQFTVPSWCNGDFHWASLEFSYRISSTNGWGPFHIYQSPGVVIAC